MIYTVSTKDIGEITFGETDLIKSVLQNVKIILTTRRNTVPLYRDFGLPMQFVDRPSQAARLLMMSEIKEAVEEFEPRARVLDVRVQVDILEPEKFEAVVEVEIRDE